MLRLTLQLAEHLEERPVLVIEPVHGRGRVVLDRLGVGQHLAFAGQPGQFAAAQGRLVQLVALEADEGQLALAFLPIRFETGKPSSQLAHFAGLRAIAVAARLEVAIGVERAELESRLQQRLAFALAVDVHQRGAELAQRRQRHGLVVAIGGASAARVQAAHENELLIVERPLQNFLGGLAQTGLDQLETADDAQLLGAGANQIGGAALPEQEAERRQQQRLAGAGLAGPGAEARLQLDAHVLDQGHILYREFAKHYQLPGPASVVGPASRAGPCVVRSRSARGTYRDSDAFADCGAFYA